MASALPKAETRVTEVCRHCGRVVSKRSRKGIYWKCPHCQKVNPGPAMVESMAEQPHREATRRHRRRKPEEEAGIVPELAAPAPVTRVTKVRKGAPSGSEPAVVPTRPPASQIESAPAPSAVTAPPPSPPSPRQPPRWRRALGYSADEPR